MKRTLYASISALLALASIMMLVLLLVHPVAAATILVTNGNDAGAGSLRQAIADAGDGDTIVFDGDYTIVLGSTLIISKDLTIDGEGQAITVSGNDAVRVFTVYTDTHVTFDNLTIARGKVTVGDGAGLSIEPGAVVTLTHSAVVSNTTTEESGRGGGLFNRGTLTVISTTFSSNIAGSSGGWTDAHGGALYSRGTLSLMNSRLSDNVAYGTGGAIYNTRGAATIQDSVVLSNTAFCGGGGIANGWQGTMTVTNSTISDNAFSGDSCESSGGGINNDGGTLTVQNSLIYGNRCEAYGGGGLGNSGGTLMVIGNAVYSNAVGADGGGLYSWYDAALIVQDCTIYSNTAASWGGGIYNGGSSSYPSLLTLTNSALFGNAGDDGGGIVNYNTPLTVTNSTIYSNMATGSVGYGGGLYGYGDSTPMLVNTILWGNTATSGDPQLYRSSTTTPTISHSDVEGSGGSGSWDTALGIDGGGNIDADPSFVDAHAGDLRLQLDSPAIDAGDNSAVPDDVTTDLAGAPRFVDVATVSDSGNGTPPLVDMGAYETGPNLTLHKSADPSTIPYQDVVTYTLRLINAGLLSDTVLLTDTLPTSVTFGGWVISPMNTLRSGNAITWTGTISAGEGITATFIATHTGGYAGVIANTAHFSGTLQTGQADATFAVRHYFYLPLVMRNY